MGTIHMSKVCQRLVSIILAGADLTFLPAGECRDNFTVAAHFYVKMRVFYAVKFFNTSLAERPRNKRNRKGTRISACFCLPTRLDWSKWK